jgi:hypothetical protein
MNEAKDEEKDLTTSSKWIFIQIISGYSLELNKKRRLISKRFTFKKNNEID